MADFPDRKTARPLTTFGGVEPLCTAHELAEDRLAVLTQREREVLALVGQGLSNQEIAARLVLSPATARTHVSRTMVKLRARDRAQLVIVAHQTGLVSPTPARLTARITNAISGACRLASCSRPVIVKDSNAPEVPVVFLVLGWRG